MCLLGNFARHTVVSEANCIPLHDDKPLDRACLLGCGVVTGWGPAVYAGGVRADDTAVVVGIGGIGVNAVQGAALAGAEHLVTVDSVEFKRQQALEFGATHAVSTSEQALDLVTVAPPPRVRQAGGGLHQGRPASVGRSASA